MCRGTRTRFCQGSPQAPVRVTGGQKSQMPGGLHAGTFPFLAKFVLNAGPLAAVGG